MNKIYSYTQTIFLFYTIVAAIGITAAITSNTLLPQVAMASSLSSFDATAASSIQTSSNANDYNNTSSNSTTNGNVSANVTAEQQQQQQEGGAGYHVPSEFPFGNFGVRILHIHTQPAIVHQGDTFKVIAVVQNIMPVTISYTDFCSPISPEAIFDKNVVEIGQKVCNVLPVLHQIKPGNSTTIEIPGRLGEAFNATGTGLTHGKVIFNYEIKDMNNMRLNASRPFSFVIHKEEQQQEQPSKIQAKLDELFKLRMNQAAFIQSENLTIKFTDVNDFRCAPHNLKSCIWEGDGVVFFNVTNEGASNSNTTTSTSGIVITLGVNNRLANSTQIIDGGQYTLHLLSLERYPTTTTMASFSSNESNSISKSDYFATLLVTKTNTNTAVSTVLLKPGERDGPLQITQIFPDHITGIAFQQYPIVSNNGTSITMKIGDTVNNGCNTSLTLLGTYNNDSIAAFLKILVKDKMCPL